MKIDAKVRYHTPEHDWLCFRHAVLAAMEGTNVRTEIEVDYDMPWCELCMDELDAEAEERAARRAEEMEKACADNHRKWKETRARTLKQEKLNRDQETVREEVNQFIQGHLPKGD